MRIYISTSKSTIFELERHSNVLNSGEDDVCVSTVDGKGRPTIEMIKFSVSINQSERAR